MTSPDAPAPTEAPTPTVTTTASRPHIALVAGIVAAVVLVDQLSKSWAVEHLRDRVIHIVWTLQLNLSFNSGMAFSQGTGLTTIITVIAVPLVVGLCWWATRMTRRTMAVALALLIGGAVGNLADRLFRDHGGAVVDFIDLRWWPVFNLADAALSVGVVVLLIASFREHGEAS